MQFPDLNASLLGVSLQTWIMAGAVVLLMAVAHVALGWWTRRRARRQQAAPPGSDQSATISAWLVRGLGDALPPLAFMLWLHGLCAVLGTMLDERPDALWINRALVLVGWIRGLGTLLGLAWLLSRVSRTFEAFLVAHASRSEASWDDVMLPFAGRALRIVLPLLALILGTPALAVAPEAKEVIQNAMSLALIGAIGLILVQFVNAMARLFLQRYRLDVSDNRQARGIYTQITVLRKIAVSLIALIAIASMLMVFQPVRQLGTAMIASAGVAGIVVGFAAQKSLGTLLAGIQIALTQPVRIDDVVIVEGEWGRIEEITLTYVVVRIWDLRRLVVPITYFIEKPFQNWTRTSADILGTVFLQVDYSVPVEALRAELTRILEASPLWDRKVNVLQVTEARDHTLELRALASSANASDSWDLRCEIREKLVSFLQKNYPGSLPRIRASLEKAATEEQPLTSS